jgi:hypothetical protein
VTEVMLNPEDLEQLKSKLHREVDRLIDEAIAGLESSPKQEDSQPARVRGLEPFDYPWPVIGTERFHGAAVYSIATSKGPVEAILGWTERDAWSRSRLRAVVFGYNGTDFTPHRWYPWTEFVETDDGRFAAIIPDPSRPRSTLSDGAALPGRFAELTVERSDVLFESIRRGPSLRLVVDQTEDAQMVSHGYWVARLRRRAG